VTDFFNFSPRDFDPLGGRTGGGALSVEADDTFSWVTDKAGECEGEAGGITVSRSSVGVDCNKSELEREPGETPSGGDNPCSLLTESSVSEVCSDA
jgi:hypothetical protein